MKKVAILLVGFLIAAVAVYAVPKEIKKDFPPGIEKVIKADIDKISDLTVLTVIDQRIDIASQSAIVIDAEPPNAEIKIFDVGWRRINLINYKTSIEPTRAKKLNSNFLLAKLPDRNF